MLIKDMPASSSISWPISACAVQPASENKAEVIFEVNEEAEFYANVDLARELGKVTEFKYLARHQDGSFWLMDGNNRVPVVVKRFS